MTATAGFEARLKAQALGLGFDLAGIATLGPADTHPAFATWIAQGHHGEMDYLARGDALRADSTRPEPGMRSAIVVTLDYGGRAPDGPVARYARGADYHRVMWDRLEALLAWVRTERGDAVRGRAYVDTGPILERDLARKAGLGWFGKNTMLIHPERGSFFFIGALFLDLELMPDTPFTDEHCGTCTRCLDACPTHAFTAPGVMDARRCISYLTIEARSAIPDELTAAVGGHIYGCDICQDVCPWNVKFARELRDHALAARPPVSGRDAVALAEEILAMDEDAYRAAFRGSAMKRAKLSGLQRNAAAVLKNLRGGASSLLALLVLGGLLAGPVGPDTLGAQQAPTRPDSARTDSTRRPVAVSAVVIGATRSSRRVEDEPLRVEVIDEEEVEEKLLMTPGDITMMLNETPGLRVQTTSPGLGGANVRIQGLRGRYTQMLVDGLPLHGAQTGGLGLLQIPPMDLGAVEILKGVSSALYGGSALGGVINLISRRAEEEPVREFLLNQTSLGGTDAVMFASEQWNPNWSYTLLAGGHTQDRVDRDSDGWTDVARYERGVVRPRLHWRSANGHSAMLTAGGTLELRRGGTEPGALTPEGLPFREALRTERSDVGVVARWLVGPTVVSARGTLASQAHRHRFGDATEQDAHLTSFAELSATGAALGGIWVLGAAFQQERYDARDVSGFDYVFTTPGLFAQHTVDLGPRVAVSASGRVDEHSDYGTQLSPRLSALGRIGGGWTVRASVGEGFFGPTPFTEEVEVVGLRALDPLTGLRAERGRSASVDVGGEIGAVELHASLFGSRIAHAVATREVAGDPSRLELVNALRPARTEGAELMLRAQPGPLHLSLSYTWVRATEDDPATGERRPVPLTPEHSVGALVAWENEDKGRAGLEIYRTGIQSLADDPFRVRSEPYVHLGVLVERRIGGVRVFLNAENLLDYRQTRAAPLVRPARGPGGRWTTDVWGPLDGRVFNIGVRF